VPDGGSIARSSLASTPTGWRWPHRSARGRGGNTGALDVRQNARLRVARLTVGHGVIGGTASCTPLS
jgi:hypothetical protein